MLEKFSKTTLRWLPLLSIVLGFGLLLGSVMATTPTYMITHTESVTSINTEMAEANGQILQYNELTSSEQEAITTALENSQSVGINPESISPVTTRIYVQSEVDSSYDIFEITSTSELPIYSLVGLILLGFGFVGGLFYSIPSVQDSNNQSGIRPATPSEKWDYIVVESEEEEESEES